MQTATAPGHRRLAISELPSRPAAGARRRLVRDGAAQPGPRSRPHGTFDDCIARLPDIAALGFDVVYLTPIHPIGHTNRKGRNNALKAAAGRSRQPLRHRRGRGRPRRRASGTRHARRLPPLRRGLQAARHGSGARLRRPVLARSSLAEAASGMVQAPAGRLDPLCGKPAEEIRGHRQSGFLLRRPRSRCGMRCATSCCSGSKQGVRIFRVDNPHTKPFRSGNG
jgi:starch synthase (maltosyl-transferring)